MARFHTSASLSVNTYELPGGREMVGEERILELIQERLKDLPQEHHNLPIEKIRLSNKSFDPMAAQKIVEDLRSHDGIYSVDMSDIIAGRPEEMALEVLSVFSRGFSNYPLEELNLSENALGSKGILACRELLERPTLQVSHETPLL